jgi:hypothetical protein
MKFLVSRTSNYSGESPPCSGAVFYGGEWPMRWTIELSDLEALMQFVRDNGRVIIELDPVFPVPEGLPEIEIYDDYRE